MHVEWVRSFIELVDELDIRTAFGDALRGREALAAGSNARDVVTSFKIRLQTYHFVKQNKVLEEKRYM